MIKSLDLNCEVNTGYINKLKHFPESCNLDISNAPKNAKNGLVSVKKLNYYWYFPSCINDQKLGLKLCEVNTGCINKLKHVPESCNLDLSNAPNNAKNSPVSV